MKGTVLILGFFMIVSYRYLLKRSGIDVETGIILNKIVESSLDTESTWWNWLAGGLFFNAL